MWPFLFSPLGKKIMLVVGVAILLFSALKWYENKIRADEAAKQADAATQQIEKLRAADRAATERILQDAQVKQQEAEARMRASLDRETRLIQSIGAIQSSRVEAVQKIQQVADSALHGYNIQQLAVRAAGDNTVCYLPAEERAIAGAISQYPLCQKQVEAQAAQISEVKQQVQALTDKTAALETKLDAVTAYTGRLEGYYSTLHDMLSRKHRSPKCLWLWACKSPKPLSVPPLEVLKSQKLKD